MRASLPARFEKVLIFGPGAWGSALGGVLKANGHPVQFWGLENKVEDLSKCLDSKTLVLLATPFKEIHHILGLLKGRKIAGLINASKGIDRETLKTFTPLAKKYLRCPLASLSGPTFAEEVQQQKPSACVLAGENRGFINAGAVYFSTDFFRVYTSTDPLGVETCGALKNVMAIACGLSDGLGLGMNARAALLTRGLNEISMLVKSMGGKHSTVSGLAGVGDLWLTATGDLSRNRQLGLQLATGKSLEQILAGLSGPAEGFYTVMQVRALAKKFRLEIPICEQVYKICLGEQDPRNAIRDLMTRALKPEDSSSRKRLQKASSKR